MMYGDFVSLAVARHARGARFGQFTPGLPPPLDPYWWDYVSLEQIEYLDARVEHLNTDVVDYDLPDAPNPLTEPEAYNAWDARRVWLTSFRWDWTTFYTSWNQWAMDASSSPIRRIGSENLAEYDNFRSRYNELRRQWRAELGTGATQASEAQPEAGKPAGSKGKGAVSEAMSTIQLASLAVVAVAAVWLLKGSN